MRHPFHVPPTTRLTLVELERREVVSETLSFLAAGLIADSLGPAAGADTPARAARTSTAADPPATPVMPDLFAPSTAPAAAPERLPATPANHHAAAVGTADDSSDAFGPFGDPARPLRPAPTAPDGTPPHGGAGTPAPDARAERRPAPVSPSGAGTGSPVRTATPAGDVQVGPAAAAAPRPVTAAAPTTTAGAEPSSSAGGGAAMSSDEGDCDCCCQPPVFIRAVDPTAITWTVDAETGATTAAFLVYRGGSTGASR